jgi:hypothetical protein
MGVRQHLQPLHKHAAVAPSGGDKQQWAVRARALSEPPVQSSMTSQPRSGTQPMTRSTFGWFSVHLRTRIDTRRPAAQVGRRRWRQVHRWRWLLRRAWRWHAAEFAGACMWAGLMEHLAGART